MTEGPYIIEDWCQDGNLWDHDTGAPGIDLFSRAIQVWSVCQNRDGITIAEAALAFNVIPERIVEAIEHHPWMDVIGTGDIKSRVIWNEGE